MAALASASVTLAAVVDVEAVYRYYLLQSSTLDKPSPPGSYPPTGEWTDTEPGYTPGSTNSLYFVDLTLFCDGSCSCSAVSLSSSYEAAKEAYNKALAAEESAGTAAGIAQAASEQLTAVTQNTREIILEALAEYATTSDLGTLEETVSSQLAILAEQIELRFTQTSARIEDVNGDLQARYSELVKYFKFTAEGLVIGLEGDQLTLKVDNDRISFLDGGLEVAYISDKQLFITDAHFLNALRVGSFAWMPRRSGNLSLVKVGD